MRCFFTSTILVLVLLLRYKTSNVRSSTLKKTRTRTLLVLAGPMTDEVLKLETGLEQFCAGGKG